MRRKDLRETPPHEVYDGAVVDLLDIDGEWRAGAKK